MSVGVCMCVCVCGWVFFVYVCLSERAAHADLKVEAGLKLKIMMEHTRMPERHARTLHTYAHTHASHARIVLTSHTQATHTRYTCMYTMHTTHASHAWHA